MISRWTVFYPSIGIYESIFHRWIIPSSEVKSFSKIFFLFCPVLLLNVSLCHVRVQMRSTLKKVSSPCWSYYQILLAFQLYNLAPSQTVILLLQRIFSVNLPQQNVFKSSYRFTVSITCVPAPFFPLLCHVAEFRDKLHALWLEGDMK